MKRYINQEWSLVHKMPLIAWWSWVENYIPYREKIYIIFCMVRVLFPFGKKLVFYKKKTKKNPVRENNACL